MKPPGREAESYRVLKIGREFTFRHGCDGIGLGFTEISYIPRMIDCPVERTFVLGMDRDIQQSPCVKSQASLTCPIIHDKDRPLILIGMCPAREGIGAGYRHGESSTQCGIARVGTPQ